MLANTSAPTVLALVPLAVMLRERERRREKMVLFIALSETNNSPEL
jgi:hypothetical protein